MESAGDTNLEDQIFNNHYFEMNLSNEDLLYIFKQIVSAVQYLHRNYIFHRDIKPRNVQINTRDLTAKQIDYGLSCFCTYKLNFLFCGTAAYMSPEIVEKRGYEGGPSDCWSLGVLLYTIIHKRGPFGGIFLFVNKR